jgi:hypothetical protein
MARRHFKRAGIVIAEMLGAMVLFTGGVAALVTLVRPAVRRHKMFDLEVFDKVKEHTNEVNTQIMSAVTQLARHEFLIPANLALIAYFLFIRKRSWFSVRVAAVALSSLGLMLVLKFLFKRPRPLEPLLQQARGMSFPSGHALMSVTFYGLLIYIIYKTQKDKPFKWPLIISIAILIQLIGFSRIYLRVHYATDVLAGFVIGLTWLVISLDTLRRIEYYNKEHGGLPPPPLPATK